jgi:hypothetical protein
MRRQITKRAEMRRINRKLRAVGLLRLRRGAQEIGAFSLLDTERNAVVGEAANPVPAQGGHARGEAALAAWGL